MSMLLRALRGAPAISSLQPLQFCRFASKGAKKNGRDSNPKYLGVKVTQYEFVPAGGIIVRQRGTRIHPGKNVGLGKDHTIYSLIPGYVSFRTNRGEDKKFCDVTPIVPNQKQVNEALKAGQVA